MRELLSITMPRCFKTKGFVFGVILTLLVPFFTISNAKRNPDFTELPFSTLEMIPMVIAVIAGLYISRDYTQNTIRKKIVAGHSRVSIYMTNWLTSTAAAVALYAIYLIFTFVYGSTKDGFDNVNDWGPYIRMMGYAFISLMYFTAMVVFICMTVKSIGGTIFSFLLFYGLMLTTLIVSVSESEEMFKILTYVNPALELVMIHSCGQAQEYSFEGYNLYMIPVCALALNAVFTALGITIFRKTDVK